MSRRPIAANVYIPASAAAEQQLGIEPGGAIAGSAFGGRARWEDPQPVMIDYPNGEGTFEERLQRAVVQHMAPAHHSPPPDARKVVDSTLLLAVGEFTVAPPHVLTWRTQRERRAAEAWIARWHTNKEAKP